jgi:hypothetical protein
MAEFIAANGSIAAENAVPNFIPDWRPLWDSNPCSHRERVLS